ncbi:MAG: ArsR family transcriptional regulator [Candidatus Asgardarchaeia archaeon]
MSTKIEDVLRGNALRIYLLLLKKGREMGVREIQRELKLSSPSLVSYHLNKLLSIGVVKKTENDLYYASELVNSSYLRDFIKLKGLILPRFLFYSVFSTTSLLSLATIFRPPYLSREYIFSVVILSILSCLLWFETYRFWKRHFSD